MKKILAASLISFAFASTALAAPGETETVSAGPLNAVTIKAGDDTYTVLNFKLVLIVQKSKWPMQLALQNHVACSSIRMVLQKLT